MKEIKESKICEYFLNATGAGRYCKAESCIYDPKYQRDLGKGFGKICTVDGNLNKIFENQNDKKRLEKLMA